MDPPQGLSEARWEGAVYILLDRPLRRPSGPVVFIVIGAKEQSFTVTE